MPWLTIRDGGLGRAGGFRRAGEPRRHVSWRAGRTWSRSRATALSGPRRIPDRPRRPRRSCRAHRSPAPVRPDARAGGAAARWPAGIPEGAEFPAIARGAPCLNSKSAAPSSWPDCPLRGGRSSRGASQAPLRRDQPQKLFESRALSVTHRLAPDTLAEDFAPALRPDRPGGGPRAPGPASIIREDPTVTEALGSLAPQRADGAENCPLAGLRLASLRHSRRRASAISAVKLASFASSGPLCSFCRGGMR